MLLIQLIGVADGYGMCGMWLCGQSGRRRGRLWPTPWVLLPRLGSSRQRKRSEPGIAREGA